MFREGVRIVLPWSVSRKTPGLNPHNMVCAEAHISPCETRAVLNALRRLVTLSCARFNPAALCLSHTRWRVPISLVELCAPSNAESFKWTRHSAEQRYVAGDDLTKLTACLIAAHGLVMGMLLGLLAAVLA